ncbi:hypothetical protein Tco_0377811, partial [Tanacetum coccineum]
MADQIQNNLALEERLDKQGIQLYNLENLNIPHKVSKAVNEIVTNAEEARKKRQKRRDIPRTPPGSPPSQPPPLPPLADTFGAPGTLGASGSSQLPPPPPPLSTGTSGSAQQQGNKAPSLSKIAASASQSMAWTTSDTRYESVGVFGTHELSPNDSLMQDDSIPEKQ